MPDRRTWFEQFAKLWESESQLGELLTRLNMEYNQTVQKEVIRAFVSDQLIPHLLPLPLSLQNQIGCQWS